ncbi:MAG: hypothetical protein KJ798_04505 [Gammaproteobacteria bacterium]|nr:hypothetical protein [Gammaproteobacteria bacterium]MBU0849352.1 hypothetical protein [Gammaproteobacteria bacterium]MBU1779627.1 hypothetical protein [Gammaproteobacteria bacterium]MBU2088527.1 hypothetical protein [Gammaproteobacteria bacterium]MBU2128509.1 hypothetical protein [Gammaproteobacteria bacterium]
MSTKVPLIGFDRFVDFAWCRAALDAAVTQSSIEVVRDQVGLMLPGIESQRKTLDVLKRLSTKPFEHLDDFIDRGIAIYKRLGQDAVLPLVWGASIASYPFFGKTCETVGRLLALQGDCSIKELQRRIAEQYGDRSGVERAVARVLQSQESWHALTRDETAKRVFKLEAVVIHDDELTAWAIEAAVRYTGKPVSVPGLQSLPVLFPFNFTRPLAYVVSNSPNLILRSEGPSNQFVALRGSI